jgi:hypothetical protein
MSLISRVQGHVEYENKEKLKNGINILQPWIEDEETITVDTENLRIIIEPNYYRNLSRFVYFDDPYDFKENPEGNLLMERTEEAKGGFVAGAEEYYLLEISTDGEFLGRVYDSSNGNYAPEDVETVNLNEWGEEVVGDRPEFGQDEYMEWQIKVGQKFLDKYK